MALIDLAHVTRPVSALAARRGSGSMRARRAVPPCRARRHCTASVRRSRGAAATGPTGISRSPAWAAAASAVRHAGRRRPSRPRNRSLAPSGYSSSIIATSSCSAGDLQLERAAGSGDDAPEILDARPLHDRLPARRRLARHTSVARPLDLGETALAEFTHHVCRSRIARHSHMRTGDAPGRTLSAKRLRRGELRRELGQP